MHNHHIIPKHMGGSDDPSNLIELTVDEHAQAHKELWEMCGREEDRIAWLSLSGLITHEEARIAAIKVYWSKPGTREKQAERMRGIRHEGSHTQESKEKIGAARRGAIHTPEARAKISEAGRKRPYSEETRRKQSLAMKARSKSIHIHTL